MSSRVLGFLRAVLAGTLAGAAPVLLVTVPLGLTSLPEGLNGDGAVLPSLWIALFPIAVTFPLVLLSAFAFGLPLAALLVRYGRESDIAYIGAGASIGSVLVLLILLWMRAEGGYWLCFLGLFSGGVTGNTWWRSREQARWRD